MSPESRVPSSLFDRLTSEEAADYRRSVLRDVAHLLNSRGIEAEIPEEFELTRESVLTYGVRDFTGLNLNRPDDREAIRREVEHALHKFEPRLSQLSVEVQISGSSRLSLRFVIHGVLETESGSEAVRLNATLGGAGSGFEVSG